ncbi:arsinothricin resistance N-acetyltransferase ArsN1 [Saccharibacillus sp. CPCC 101409]|uniref:arsinothricin resistance N-acetyltransferase ArsN1 family A n=1 Tax=Saccharibacillus sp. CPCC 101409 TaxID=3058041 RepID=UPI0026732B47|nr:arsinothricin resistance N-acetyltransferase ArsN1 family A [Saccharibacillus sp. CPCC 101409]MDO3408327.1 arsinothricin resistance N-acetyltransferase ArsN1 [Saccharibacillus sp. CPCC 101409]
MEQINDSRQRETVLVRSAGPDDLAAIRDIYNQGIEDRVATLETQTKSLDDMRKWFEDHRGRYAVLVAEQRGGIVGWASLNRYSQRSAYDGVADLSVYIARSARGAGVGSRLLKALEAAALEREFYKIVLFTFPFNSAGQRLYRKMGYREVGTFEKQGILDGERIDVMIMEKLLG